MKPRKYVDIHIPYARMATSERYSVISSATGELIRLFAERKVADFTTEEFGPFEAVLGFECRRPLRVVLPIVQQILDQYELSSGSYYAVRNDPGCAEPDLLVPTESVDIELDKLAEIEKEKPKIKYRRAKVGDFYAVPLAEGRFGHLRYAHKDETWGDLVEVFSVITARQPSSITDLEEATMLFPPVLTPVAVGIRVGGWAFLGNQPRTEKFCFPTFRTTGSLVTSQHKPGTYDDWWLWDGSKEWFVGRLDDAERKLEYRVWWPPHGLAERIATGENEYDHFL